MSKRKTQEQYIKELKEKNQTIEVVGKYISNRVNILHRCKICGYEWNPKPHNVLSGTGCPKCANNIKRTHEKYILDLNKKNIKIKVLGKYINNGTPILHKCNYCQYEWYVMPSNVLSGHGCPKCANKKATSVTKKTHSQYIDDLKKVNPNINVLGTYKNARTHMVHKCSKCGHEWSVTPNNLLKGNNCPKCSKRHRRTHEEYVEELSKINPFNEVIAKFINIDTPILHHCLIHNKYWKQSPYNALMGYGCSECGSEKIKNKLKKTHEEYVNQVKEKNPDIQVVGTYVNSNTAIIHKCLLDGHEWSVLPSTILNGGGCPQCNESKGERQIRQWLEIYNIKYIYQHKYDDCKDILSLPFDFYLPDYNALIEYDGEHHFRPVNWSGSMTDKEISQEFETVKLHDSIKNNYCENNGIFLLRIPYFKNIEEELDIFLN